MGDNDYAAAFKYVVTPVVEAFDPQAIIVSCGFDAARYDIVGKMDLTPLGYAYMTHSLISLSGRGIFSFFGLFFI